MSLAGRRIVLGVSGGIAAYKAAYLVRLLMESGCEVRCVMTPAASDFIGPATLAGLSGHPVVLSLTAHPGSVSPHTDLAKWADLVVVAPATAATLARLAHGISGDPVSATVLASRAPLLVAPAMHTEMWEHAATQRSIELLIKDGVEIVGPESGRLAGGDDGSGRMVEPEALLAAISQMLSGPMDGTTVLVTAGGTREPIDPVRYVGNRSSGKMGHSIAEEAARLGAEVTLVTTSSIPTTPSIHRIQVETAVQMDEAVRRTPADIAVMAAAVADFRPSSSSEAKLSRADGPPEIVLEDNPDILAGVGSRRPRPFLIGFSAEAGGVERAFDKAKAKGVDLMVANDVAEEGSGFGTDTNRVTVIDAAGESEEWPLMHKDDVARRLWAAVIQRRDPSGVLSDSD